MNLWNQPLRRSLRFQFTLSMLMLLIPSFALSYLAVSHLAMKSISELVRVRLNDEASLLAYGLREWDRAKNQSIASLALAPALRSRDQAGIRSLLRGVASIYPHRTWAYFLADARPHLLVYSRGSISPEMQALVEDKIQHKVAYQQALRGWSAYGIERSLFSGSACLMLYQPVYKSGLIPLGNNDSRLSMHAKNASALGSSVHPLQLKFNEKPTAVLKSCIPLNDLGDDTGLTRALANSRLANIQGIKGDFGSNKPLKRAFVLISRKGHVLYPTQNGLDTVMPTVADYEKGYWGPLFRMIHATMQSDVPESFKEVRIGADKYFVLVNQLDQSWHTMMMLNEKYAYGTVDKVLRRLLVYGILSLILASLATAWLSGRIINPIQVVSRTLRRISDGDFEVKIQHDRRDEIGQLLDDVNRTSERLKAFVISETANAVTRKQLETARVIQKDFLVECMPESGRLELEPLSIPAYEVGADWYDALKIGETIYIVVADVCDKGIPSALYMSVFRSLLRYGLLTWGDDAVSPDVRLCHAVTSVNDYMATNHGGSMMFATAFIAALDPESGALSYISAGHEMPMISVSDGLRSLEPTGPAIGLFPGCSYGIGHDQLAPGDYLVAYTDGLTDARSPDDASFGHEALKDFMLHSRGSQPSAATIRADLLAAVQVHMAGADYFDDLTLMVLHRKA